MTPTAFRRSLRRVSRVAAGAFDALVPAACVGCRRGMTPQGPPLCGLCKSRMPRLPRPRCRRCAEPLGNVVLRGSLFDRCGTCESWPGSLVAADAPFIFEGVAAQTVRSLKYGRWRSLASYMAGPMVPSIEAVLARLEADSGSPRLVPVPLTAARYRERGFNQASDLARALAKHGVGELREELVRAPGGGRQAGLAGGLRRANVQGRFGVLRTPARPDRAAIIIDDVLTTGATAIACAEALAEAGFRRVATVSFARTLRPLDSDEAK